MSRAGDTLFFETPVHVQTWGSAVGTKEGLILQTIVKFNKILGKT